MTPEQAEATARAVSDMASTLVTKEYLKSELDGLRIEVKQQFVEMDQRFTGQLMEMDQRFTAQFTKVDERLLAMGQQFTGRFTKVDERFMEMDQRLTKRLNKVNRRLTRMNARFKTMDASMKKRFASQTVLMVIIQTALLGAMFAALLHFS